MAMVCRREIKASFLPFEPPALRDENQMRVGIDFGSMNGRERKLVCVTSGNSYIGAHLVKKLLGRGYSVRVTIQNQANIEDMKDLLGEEELNQIESVVVARMGSLESLSNAFRGCHAIFHTSSFIDPHGISGYTERMAFLETEGARNVIEACSRTAYVKRCIFTSSLLASVWKGIGIDRVMDESCWSNEDYCRENKLWLALGKTRAEKMAWRRAKELKVNLITLCPGLVMAPCFPNAHKESSVPYLKGGQAMLQRGLLATEDVMKVAEAHVYVYEDMDYGAWGRYLCFGRVITRMEEAIELENVIKRQGLLSGGYNVLSSRENEEISANISNSKLIRLVNRASTSITCKDYFKCY